MEMREINELMPQITNKHSEICEQLEQLRALELGIQIHVSMAASRSPAIGVDTAEDLAAVQKIIEEMNRG